MAVSTNKLVAEPRYHSPDSLVWLLGNANEVMVVVEEVETIVLVDTGSHISTLTERFCTDMGLRILPLGDLIWGVLYLKGIRHIWIPYKEYVEVSLTIPDLPQYNEDMLLLVIADHKYGERVPVQIGTQVIDHLVATMTEKELQQTGETSKTGTPQHCNFQKECHEEP